MVENKVTKNRYFYSVSVITLTVIISLALVFLIIVPFFNKSKELTKETSIKQEELNKLKEKKTRLEALKSKEEELKLQAEKVSNALPEDKDIGRLFIQIDNLAKSNGGSLSSVTEGGERAAVAAPVEETAAEEVTPTIQKVSYIVPVDFATYFNFKEFVTKTEAALRLTTIVDFEITADDPAKPLKTNLNITTYIRSPK